MARFSLLIFLFCSVGFAATPGPAGDGCDGVLRIGTGSGVGGGEISETSFKQIVTRALTQLKETTGGAVLDKQIPIDLLLSELPAIDVDFTPQILLLDGRVKDGLNQPSANYIWIDRKVWISASYGEKELLALHEVFSLKLRGLLDDSGNRYSLEVQRLLAGTPRDPSPAGASGLESVGKIFGDQIGEAFVDPKQWYMNSAKKVLYICPQWSAWEETSSSYMGGAHGSVGVKLMVFDSSGDRVLFSDVLNASRAEMIEVIHAKVRATLADRYAENFFQMWAAEKSVISKLNYSADASGVRVYFNQYDIAPYAAGPMEIKFTWAELKPLLKADSVFRDFLK